MMAIHSYLTFNGNCREAMVFYKNCLGGELYLQTIGESPVAEKMPEKIKNYILHSTLTKDSFVLMASDMVEEKGLIKGNSVSLMLDCSSEEELKHCYNCLSEEGEQTHPVELSFWGAWFGNLTDKYGNHWLLHYQKKQ
jgi:PhnB protein